MPHFHHYPEHIKRLRSIYSRALNQSTRPFSAIMIHSGSEAFYYADDQSMPFRAYGHFSHWLPVNHSNQVLLVIPNNVPIFFQICPSDFWHEQDCALPSWVEEEFETYTLSSSAQVADELHNILSKAGIAIDDVAFIGENTQYADAIGLSASAFNPPAILSYLDYHRAYKSEYEIACIRKANRIALQGHQAARQTFLENGSEYAIHMAYLNACEILEEECPYTNIVALNEKSAILHYQNKRRKLPAKSQVLLIDAGCRFNGYCSDITRTYTQEYTHPVFQSILESMQVLQSELVSLVRPGREYLAIHESALKGIANILADSTLSSGSAESILETGLPSVFMPHGVGHLLGLQVHDVGGRQVSPLGEIKPPPNQHPALRTTRPIETDQVFTIEPGFYFIPQLLNVERSSTRGQLLNWDLVDALTPLGGIRIEDNVRVTKTGVENLTRLLI
jgi:Xaa-Pro dipeptidase